MAAMRANPLDRLDPDLALRPGSFDAHTVLFLWCVRKTFYPLIWLGFSVAFLAFGDAEAMSREFEGIDTPQEMLSHLLSPFGIIVLALGLRIVVGFVALLAAFLLTLGTPKYDHARNRLAGWFNFWRDRLYRARAYRALRQTWDVRERAYQRLDLAARVYSVCESVLNWANVVLLVSLLTVVVLTAGSAGS